MSHEDKPNKGREKWHAQSTKRPMRSLAKISDTTVLQNDRRITLLGKDCLLISSSCAKQCNERPLRKPQQQQQLSQQQQQQQAYLKQTHHHHHLCTAVAIVEQSTRSCSVQTDICLCLPLNSCPCPASC
ncbi:hypothetical protein ACLKA7_007263 [Drosophila subpalustris]